jgi:hypothetical protein
MERTSQIAGNASPRAFRQDTGFPEQVSFCGKKCVSKAEAHGNVNCFRADHPRGQTGEHHCAGEEEQGCEDIFAASSPFFWI